MKFFTSLLFILFFLLINTWTKAQVADYGQNPPGLYWNKILSPHFQVIFPKGLENRAERLVNVLEKVYYVENYSLPVKTQPITIILQNQPVESNAFVLLAPRRSEFNTLPPQDLEPIDWLNSLAIHEMRHVVQIDRVFNGKELSILESIQIGVFGLVYPTWFFEGDAVGMETILSDAGRGRLPSWEVDLRANVLSGKDYSYSKYTLGSTRDNIPDYYRIGYFMVTKMRRDYGDSLFNKIYTGALHLGPYPFSTSLKKNTGLNTEELYKKTISELKQKWGDSLSKFSLKPYPSYVIRPDSVAFNYLLPKPLTKGTLLFLGKGLERLPAIYALNLKNKHITRKFTIGSQTNPNFDYKNGLVCWDEIRLDPRYQYRTYNDLFTYDLVTRKKKQLTRQSKLFSPALDPKAKKLVAVQVKSNYSFNLVLLDLRDGKLIKELPNPNHYFFETPTFDSTGQKILATIVNSSGKAIYEYDLNLEKGQILKPFSYEEINRVVYGPENTLIYQSGIAGIDQIYSFNYNNHQEKVLTSSRFGAYAPYLQGDQVWFENFTALGKDIGQFSLKEAEIFAKKSQIGGLQYFKPLISREPGGTPEFRKSLNDLADENKSLQELRSRDTAIKDYRITKFNEFTHLLYFHSLLPDLQNLTVNENTFLAGLKLTSTNLLNTLQTSVGVYYQNGINAAEYQAGISYKKYYPILNLNFDDKKRDATAIGKTKTGIILVPYSYRSRILNLGLTVPLNFISTKENYNLLAEINTSYQNNYDLSIPLSRFKSFVTNIKFPLHYKLLFEKNRILSVRDLYPAWGQNVSLDFEHLPFSSNFKGHYFSMSSGFYFPGIFLHHVLRLGFNYQYNVGIYQGQRVIDEINGFESLPPNNLQNTFLANYYFPIAYPDLELSRYAYVRKISGGIFFDRENLGTRTHQFAPYTTYGVQLRTDFNLLRYYLPIFQIGLKSIFFQDRTIKGPQFVLNVSYSL